jgi:DNA anti-recombination protein RmuC
LVCFLIHGLKRKKILSAFSGLSVLMKSIKDRLELHEVQKASIQKQLEEAEIRHSQQMDTTANEMLIKYEQLLEKRTTEINEKHASEISAITKEHDEKLSSLLNSSTQSQTEVALVIV